MMRFEDSLMSNPKEEICAAAVQPCEPGCPLVNMVISPRDTSDAAMKDPESAKFLLQVHRCSGDRLGTWEVDLRAPCVVPGRLPATLQGSPSAY